MPLLRTVFIGSSVTILVISAIDPERLRFSCEFSLRALSWIKTIVIVGILGIMIFVEVFPCALPVIDTLNYAESEIRPYINYQALVEAEKDSLEQTEESEIKVLSIIDENETSRDTGDAEEVDRPAAKYYSADINSGTVIEQPFVVTSERTISEICFQCYNTDSSRWNRGRICISVVDADMREVLREETVGSSMVITGEIYIVNIEEINLPKGNYLIRITNIEPPREVPFTSSSIYMMCNPDEQNVKPASINGQKMEFPVCVCVN